MSSVIHAANATIPNTDEENKANCGTIPKLSGPITISEIRLHVTEKNAAITAIILSVLNILDFLSKHFKCIT